VSYITLLGQAGGVNYGQAAKRDMPKSWGKTGSTDAVSRQFVNRQSLFKFDAAILVLGTLIARAQADLAKIPSKENAPMKRL
jgi:hypothetical protein